MLICKPWRVNTRRVMADTRRWRPLTHSTMNVKCPECAQRVDVPSHQIRLYRCTSKKDQDFYTFTCPGCDHPAAVWASAQVVCILIASEVRCSLFTLPLEMGDLERSAFGGWSRYDEADLLLDIQALPEFTGDRKQAS